MKIKALVWWVLLLGFLAPVYSQPDSTVVPKTVSWMFGFGKSGVLDTYLTPYQYSGTDYRLMMEHYSPNRTGSVANVHNFNLNYTYATNFSGRGVYYVGFFDYSYSRIYRAFRNDRFRLLMGPAIDLDLGCIYNVRNSNNPAQAKVNLNLDYTAKAEYFFKVRHANWRLNYQFSMPLLGVGFAPEYGQSYYEIFGLGNTAGIVHFLSLHNQWAMQNRLVVDIPLWGNWFRFGYYGKVYQSRINQLETSIISHNIVVGYSGDILRLDRRKTKGGYR